MSRQKLETVSAFARNGYKLRLTCEACGHVVDVNPIEMIGELHRRKLSFKIEAIEDRAKCSRCGERKASIRAVSTEW